MGKGESIFEYFYSRLLSEEVRKKSEIVIISIAIVSFLAHLILVALVNLNWIGSDALSSHLTNPISAIYTPFSFILIYEVYLLVYYLPKSTTNYIGKQYEIITLIVIRSLFKDLANLQFSSDWFRIATDLQFTFDLIATIILFFLIYIFYRLNHSRDSHPQKGKTLPHEIIQFIRLKNIMAMLLIPVFFILAIYGFYRWIHGNLFDLVESMKDANMVFFNDFFTVLILTDVLILLISFLYTDKFSKVIRNSGFIISTILIKLSFGTEGLLNAILVVVAVLFGVIILLIHNQYEKIRLPEN
jgi:hypothetical protein